MSTGERYVTWCVLDIETIPSLDPDIMSTIEVKPDSRLKDPGKITADVAQKMQKAYNDTSFDPLHGSICAIGIKTSLGDKHVFTAYSTDPAEHYRLERQAILDANQVLAGTPCAWNGHDFDFRFMAVRAMKYGVSRLPGYLLRRGVDPMHRLFGKRWDDKLKLSAACKFFGIHHDNSFDGSMVANAYARGEYKKITTHLEDDIDSLWEIVNRFDDVVFQ